MAFFTRALVDDLIRKRGITRLAASADLSKAARTTVTEKPQIFLSHARLDAEHVLALKYALESMGHSTFVDWVDDHQLDRSRVTTETAARLRAHMQRSQTLFYAVSEPARDSKWMPWELGYFDGLRGKAAVLPVLDVDPGRDEYRGQEYLGLYPFVSIEPRLAPTALWINETSGRRTRFSEWMATGAR